MGAHRGWFEIVGKEESERLRKNSIAVPRYVARGVSALALSLTMSLAGEADSLKECGDTSDPARAIRACSDLVTRLPGAPGPYKWRGVAHMRLGNPDAAISDYTDALRLDANDPWLYYNRAQALVKKEDYARAIEDFSRVIERKRDSALALNGRAWAHFKKGHNADAMEDVDRALSIDPNYAASYDTRAHILEALGRRDDAIRDFRRALAISPDDPLSDVTRQGLKRLGSE